jgi:hypothetical protein
MTFYKEKPNILKKENCLTILYNKNTKRRGVTKKQWYFQPLTARDVEKK